MQYKLKPQFWAFILNKSKTIVFAAILIFFIGILFSIFVLGTNFFASILLCLIFAIICCSPFLANDIYSYFQEQYIISDKEIIKYSGNIFYKNQTSIEFTKVVSFTEYQPFLRNLIFNTKSLYIQTFGTQSSILVLNDLVVDESYLELIKKVSSINDMDFSSKENSIKPSYLNAVIAGIESSWNLFYSTSLYFIFIIVDTLMNNGNINDILTSPFQIILLIYLVFSIGQSIYQFFITLIKIYFTNFCIYEKQYQIEFGIFSKTFLFIPTNKITDIKVTRSFFEKIFNLKSISLSVPNNPSIAVIAGINKEVEFESFESEKNIEIYSDISKGNSEFILSPSKKRYLLDVIIQGLFLFFVLILGILIPQLFWILLPSGAVLYNLFILASEVFFTKYILEENFISRNYNFLTTKNLKLSKENTTSIKITESILDKLFGTFSITFFSFGGSESIRILYVNKNSEIYNYALNFINCNEKDIEEIPLRFNFIDWVISISYQLPQILLSVFFIMFYAIIFLVNVNILLIFVLFDLLTGIYIFATFNNFMAYERSKLFSSKNFLKYKYGWLFKTEQILKKSFIKDLVKIKYPLRDSYELIAHLSADLSLPNSNQNALFNFSGNIFNQINAKFLSSGSKISHIDSNYSEQETKVSSKPNFINTFIKLLPIGIIFPPFILVIAYIYFKLRFTSYICEEDKLIEKTGIFFKREKYLLFSDIDHIETNQDIINRFLGNSSINVYTSANEIIEMKIQDIENFSEVSSNIKV